MTRSERTRRFGLVLAYAAMTVWAQAGDRHGHAEPSASAVHCDADCRDPKPHYSGHSSPDLGHAPSDCPACQLRSNLHAPTHEAPALGGSIVDRVQTVEPLAPTLRLVGLACCRAPPRA